jgi:hypothetical protein
MSVLPFEGSLLISVPAFRQNELPQAQERDCRPGQGKSGPRTAHILLVQVQLLLQLGFQLKASSTAANVAVTCTTVLKSRVAVSCHLPWVAVPGVQGEA